MLSASARLLRASGRTAFVTIEPSAHLSPQELQLAIESGPPEVEVLGGSHEEMLAGAGFARVEAIDVTPEYRSTQNAWRRAWNEREDRLVALLGRELYDERQGERVATQAAIEAGLLRRTLYLGWLHGSQPGTDTGL